MEERKEKEKHYLYDELRAYCSSDAYPHHMPGHKRRLGQMEDPFTFDITEIDGFDNLHHAEGILKEAQQRAASFYGSSETCFLVNGSTCGILSAIGACAPSGRILMSRNSHKAAYHAVFVNRLEPVYLYPEYDEINGPITVEAVETALEQYPDIRAVYITSPTYDGVVSDVKKIAGVAHEHGIPLIVDEAHGAHFGMHPIFPESSVKLGADIVIHSIHKTLPSLTQTALLHVNGSLVDRRRLRKMLGIYQSSSPSYVLMSSMDQCIRLLEEKGQELFEAFAQNLNFFYEEIGDLSALKIIRTDDPSKIIISGKNTGLTGQEISQELREKYHLELEMGEVGYALALTSIGDTREGFERLARALREMDERLAKQAERNPLQVTKEDLEKQPEGKLQVEKEDLAKYSGRKMQQPATSEMSIWAAENAPQQRILLRESAGHISGEFIYLYPPGIPLVVPGERMEEEVLQQLLRNKEMGYELQGMEDYSMEYLWVVKE